MKIITYSDIKSWKPCYDPIKYIPEDWSGTAIDILNLKDALVSDRLWVVLRTELVSEKCMRLFAVWCARQVQHLINDHRSINSLDIAERFANNEATRYELTAAWAAARAAAHAARAAAGDAAGDAAWAAAHAARVADWAAASDAASDGQINKLREMIIAEDKRGS